MFISWGLLHNFNFATIACNDDLVYGSVFINSFTGDIQQPQITPHFLSMFAGQKEGKEKVDL